MVFSFTGVFVWSRLQKLSAFSIGGFLQNRKYIVSIALIVKSYDVKRNRKKPLILSAAQKMALEIQYFLLCAICRAYAVIKTFDQLHRKIIFPFCVAAG